MDFNIRLLSPILIFLLSIHNLHAMGETTSCPGGDENWTARRFHESVSCYYFSEGLETFPGARRWCRDHGADLVVIDSSEENRFVFQTLITSSVDKVEATWVGLFQRMGGAFQWVDGSDVLDHFQNWVEWETMDDMDDMYSDTCTEMLVRPKKPEYKGMWNKVGCGRHVKRHFVCEKKMDLKEETMKDFDFGDSAEEDTKSPASNSDDDDDVTVMSQGSTAAKALAASATAIIVVIIVGFIVLSQVLKKRKVNANTLGSYNINGHNCIHQPARIGQTRPTPDFTASAITTTEKNDGESTETESFYEEITELDLNKGIETVDKIMLTRKLTEDNEYTELPATARSIEMPVYLDII